MKSRLLASFISLAILAGAAFAHGDKKHVLGTLEKVNGDSIVVKQRDGKSVEVKLAPSTVYLHRDGNADKPAKASDLVVGYLVVIHATPKDGGLEADEVKFSVPGAANPANPPGQKPKS
jgi:hypothetical protein